MDVSPTALQTVPVATAIPTTSTTMAQVVATPASIPTIPSMGIIQEASQAAEGVANRVVEDRVIQQLRRIKKLVFVCFFLALYAIMKQRPMSACA